MELTTDANATFRVSSHFLTTMHLSSSSKDIYLPVMNNRDIFLALAVWHAHRGLAHFIRKAHVLEELQIYIYGYH